jgi:transcriptional regulator with XRE-family HTH domain
MKWRSEFPQRLRRRREALNLSKTALARQIGLNMVSILEFEKGRKTPSVDTLVALAEALDVSLDWLCGRND